MPSSRRRNFYESKPISSILHKNDGERVRFLRAVLNLPDTTYRDWPGVAAFFHHIEDQIVLSQKSILDPFIQALEQAGGASSPLDAHELLISIAAIFNDTNDDDASLSDHLDTLLSKHGITKSTAISNDTGIRLIFAAFCWLTCLLTPSQIQSDALCIVILPKQSGLRARQMIDNAHRPIAGLLRGFGNILPPVESKNDQTHQSELLHTSVLNFYSLKTVGKINIQWVDILSAHLEFHPLSRTLMLYRFPTMCALHCMGEEESHCANRILRSYYASYCDSTLALTALRREILLSFRVLFGQSHRSRRLYYTHERKASYNKGLHDHFLDFLCGEPYSKHLKALPCTLWPESCLDELGFLQEQDAYSLETDFPLLGPRILKVQAFSLRQNPTRIRDLWRDRRNPLQWYTFWAVLILGGLSLMLTFIQTLSAIAQLFVTIRYT